MKLSFNFINIRDKEPDIGTRVLAVWKEEPGFTCEEGVLGWNMYVFDIDERIDLKKLGFFVYFSLLPIDQILLEKWPISGKKDNDV